MNTDELWGGKIFKLPKELMEERFEIIRTDGYEFCDENDRVIEAKKIVIRKKRNILYEEN